MGPGIRVPEAGWAVGWWVGRRGSRVLQPARLPLLVGQSSLHRCRRARRCHPGGPREVWLPESTSRTSFSGKWRFFMSRAYQKIFSTSWILPINGLMTTPLPPISLPTPPMPLPTLAPPPITLPPMPRGMGSISSPQPAVGGWARPFTLRPRVGTSPFVTTATMHPPPLIPTFPGGQGGILVNGNGPSGLKGGRNRPPKPWTHSSSSSVNPPGIEGWPPATRQRPPTPPLLPKSRPPVPTTETSIEQAAIWVRELPNRLM